MPVSSTSPTFAQKLIIDVPASGWSTPVQLDLGHGGRITRSTLRAPAGSVLTEADLMIWEGTDEDTFAGSFNPAASIPDEDRVFYRTGITVAGHAVDADDDFYNDTSGTPVDGLGDFSTPRRDGATLWAAIRAATASGAQAGVTWKVRAIETNY